MRYIFDFGNPDYMEFILPTGESEHIVSRHYKDMSKMWLEGNYIKLPLREDEFVKTSKHILELIPE